MSTTYEFTNRAAAVDATLYLEEVWSVWAYTIVGASVKVTTDRGVAGLADFKRRYPRSVV